MWETGGRESQVDEVDKVITEMAGQSFKAPDGFTIKMDEKNHHLHKPVYIGEVQSNGQFNVVWKTPARSALHPGVRTFLKTGQEGRPRRIFNSQQALRRLLIVILCLLPATLQKESSFQRRRTTRKSETVLVHLVSVTMLPRRTTYDQSAVRVCLSVRRSLTR